MIVAKRDGRFVLTTNDDHARMAEQLAGMFGETALPEQDRREEVASISDYAGLLCSMHYTILPTNVVKGATGGIGPKAFASIAAAKEREKQILRKPYPWTAPATLTWKRKELSVRRTAEVGLLHTWQESPYVETSILVLPEGEEIA
jgi:hypothetical protein